MDIKKIIFFMFCLVLFSCSEDNDIIVARNLQEYIDSKPNLTRDEVIACAASSNANKSLTFVFYYPIEGATDIRYYETENASADETNFANYTRRNIPKENVFGGKLMRFNRTNEIESWAIVTYETQGKLHISNPIRIKNQSKSTSWTNALAIDFPSTLNPKFTWTDNAVGDNEIYFQVISDEENQFISGTYTYDNFFSFYDTSNVVLNINTETPQDLEVDKEYNFTLMDVSIDNWVNLVIETPFVPRNLQEYVDANSSSAIGEIISFGASANNNTDISYIYYYPETGATDIRYYETNSLAVDENNLSNYRRVFVDKTTFLGDKLSRYTKTNAQESWVIITYLIDNKLYTSKPIKVQNKSKSTEYFTDISIDFSQTLQPKFTWTDGTILENTSYFQGLTDKDDNYISGTFTTEKMFMYYDTTNVTYSLNTDTPPDLILSNEYKIVIMGISDENWVNLVRQKSFIVE